MKLLLVGAALAIGFIVVVVGYGIAILLHEITKRLLPAALGERAAAHLSTLGSIGLFGASAWGLVQHNLIPSWTGWTVSVWMLVPILHVWHSSKSDAHARKWEKASDDKLTNEIVENGTEMNEALVQIEERCLRLPAATLVPALAKAEAPSSQSGMQKLLEGLIGISWHLWLAEKWNKDLDMLRASYLESLRFMLATTMLVGDTPSEREFESFSRVMESLSSAGWSSNPWELLHSITPSELLKYTRTISVSDETVGQTLDKLKQVATTNGRELTLRSMFLVASADTVIDEAETRLLVAAGDHLEVPRARLNQICKSPPNGLFAALVE